MKAKEKIKLFTKIINFLEVIGIIFILLLAMLYQFWLNELPCPLCLIQRIGFFGLAIALLFNFKFGQRPSHYAIALLFSMLISFASLRQIVLHIVPGTGGYGSVIFGFHMYTWSFILSMFINIVTICVLGLDRQYYSDELYRTKWRTIRNILFLLIIILLIVNIVFVFKECGLYFCPSDPTQYLVWTQGHSQ